MAGAAAADEHLLVPAWIRELMEHKGLAMNSQSSTGTISKEAGAKLAVPFVAVSRTSYPWLVT